MQAQKKKERRVQSSKLPPDFPYFVDWVYSLNISRGVKQSIVAGAKKAFLLGLSSPDEVKMLPKSVRGRKTMRYALSKYEEFRSEENIFY